MAKFRVTVTERVVWSFPVEADSQEEAHRKAEEALHGDDGDEPLTLENGARVKLESKSMDFETKEVLNG